METVVPNETYDFIVKLVKVAYGYGASVLEIKNAIARLSATLGFQAEAVGQGPVARLTFWREDESEQQSLFVQLPPPNLDLSKAILIDELVADIEAGTSTVAEGSARLEQIESKPAQFGPLATGLAFVLVGAVFPVLFAASWIDVALGSLMGLVAFGILLLAGRLPLIARTLEFTTAFVAALLAFALAALFPDSNRFVLILAAIGVWLPSFLLTVGVIEILLHFTLAGIQRLVDGLLIAILLLTGAAVATAIAAAIWAAPPAVAPTPFPPVVVWLAVVLLYVAVGLFFQVRPKDFGWVILGGLITTAAMTVGNLAGAWQGAFLGALVLGIYGNLFARWRKLSASIVTLTGVQALVPMVLAYTGLFDTAVGGLQALSASVFALLPSVFAIFAGFIVAHTVVPSKE